MAQMITVGAVLLALSSLCVAEADSSRGVSGFDHPFDRRSFEALSDGKKLAFAVAALDARDQDLANFDYSLREVCTNVGTTDGARRYMTEAEYEERRLRERLWMHLTEHGFWKEGGKVRTDGFLNWDGKIAVHLSMPPYYGVNHQCASIVDSEARYFTAKQFNALLGLRIYVENRCESVLSFVHHSMNDGSKITVGLEDVAGFPAIRIDITHLYDATSIWLLPDRGYMIHRLEQTYQRREVSSLKYVEETSAKCISGVWVPVKAIHVTRNSASAEQSEFQYEVSSFRVGSVKPDDVEIKPPVGTEVTDVVHHTHYTVLPDER